MEYNQIFQPQTLEKLNKRSQDNLKKIMGNKSLMQTLISSQKLLGEIMNIEKPYKEQLEQLAIQMIEDMYPIILEDNIKIDAKITNIADVNQSLDEIKVNNPNNLLKFVKYYDTTNLGYIIFNGEKITGDSKLNDKEVRIYFDEYEKLPKNIQSFFYKRDGWYFTKNFQTDDKTDIDYKYNLNESTPESKRRVINGITQGAALHGTFSFYMFKEYLDAIDDTLVEKYNQLMKEVFGVYDDDNAIAMFLNAIAQGQKTGGGSSKVIIKENLQGPTIQARAICFPMLVHEIIKGLYELVSLQGFSGTKDQNQQVVDKVDKLENEPHDLKYGKFIYEALNNIFADSNYNDLRIKEFFFTEVYQLGDTEFVEFVENAINEQLSSTQKRWVEQTLKEISSDLKADDFDSTGLDEIKVNNPLLTPQNIINYLTKTGYFKGMYDILYGWGVEDYNNWDKIESYKNIPPENIKNIMDGLKDTYEYEKSKSINESKSPCWDGYKKVGTKEKNGKTVNNCVPINEYTIDDEEVEEFLEELKKCSIDLKEGVLEEAEYQGRKVTLNKPMQGDSKKFKVYVKNEKGNVVKINFGAKGMNIKKNNPVRRKAFRARHNCDNPGPKWKARYWSCKKW
jgi:hypothetical protein